LSHIVKYHRKVAKHYADLAVAGSDLGAAYNSWSLMEPHAPNQSIGYASSSNSLGLAHAIESVGEAVDITVSATSQLTQSIELRVTEPLAEYEKLTTAIETILKWRHARHVEYETATEALVAKRAALKKLEAAETESQRLAAVLHSEGVAAPSPRAVDARTAAIAAVSALGLGGAPDQDRRDPASATTSPRPLGSTVAAGGGGSTSSTASAGGGGLLATLNSLMDNDPEATRRAGITRTRDRIQGLEGERERSLTELGAANEAIQRDLDRFQRDKVHDLRNLLLA
ncbi:Sorting nexin, cytoplasm-to-vacuole targeting pathway/endosomal sorting, partial [Cladochytrium tenue]